MRRLTLTGRTAAACAALLFLAAFLSWIVFFTVDGPAQHVEILRWIQSGTLDSAWSIRLDRLTAIYRRVLEAYFSGGSPSGRSSLLR